MGVIIKKILLPVDVPHPSLRVMHQAATVARRFHAEMVMLHVVTRKAVLPVEWTTVPSTRVGISSPRSRERPRNTRTSLSDRRLMT